MDDLWSVLQWMSMRQLICPKSYPHVARDSVTNILDALIWRRWSRSGASDHRAVARRLLLAMARAEFKL
jgi:hypothetical protein